MTKTLAATIAQLRHTGHRRSVTLGQLEQILEFNHLVEKLSHIAPTQLNPEAIKANPSKTYLHAGVPAGSPPAAKQKHIDHISERSRVVTIRDGNDAPDFESALEVMLYSKWTTVATYQYKSGQSRRFVHYANGAIAPFDIDLPPDVVQEMCKEDFSRNWHSYQREYLRCQPLCIA